MQLLVHFCFVLFFVRGRTNLPYVAVELLVGLLLFYDVSERMDEIRAVCCLCVGFKSQ